MQIHVKLLVVQGLAWLGMTILEVASPSTLKNLLCSNTLAINIDLM